MIFQVLHDGAFQLGNAFEGAAPDAVSGDLGKEALDYVERRRCRCEVQVEARMGLEPALYGRGLMRGAVVDDEVRIEPFGGLLVDQPEKAQELTMTMAWHARPDDLAVQHVERREQRRGAVALVVVGHRAGAALLHRQAGWVRSRT